jgi:L-lysine exporter family protein LysE/ArgO
MLLEGWRQRSGEARDGGAVRRRAGATMTALALTLLNPQVYLEMVGLVGSIAIRFPVGERVVFALGVMLVSPVWFYSLALGGQRLSAFFGHRQALRVVDLATGAAMLGVGAAMAVAEIMPAAP